MITQVPFVDVKATLMHSSVQLMDHEEFGLEQEARCVEVEHCTVGCCMQCTVHAH